jgi:tetratricopeptide (TPR) repeat protein
VLLGALGRHAEAEPLHRRAFELRESVLGRTHPDTLSSTNNLAEVLAARGNLKEAEVLHRRALEARQETLGCTHQDTLQSTNNLAYVLQRNGCPGEAEMLHRRALQAREATVGPDHPDTVECARRLADLLEGLGRIMEARPFRWRVEQNTADADEVVTQVEYRDTDDDRICFAVNRNGNLDYFVNGVLTVSDLVSLRSEGHSVHLDGTPCGEWPSTWCTEVPAGKDDIVRRVVALYDAQRPKAKWGPRSDHPQLVDKELDEDMIAQTPPPPALQAPVWVLDDVSARCGERCGSRMNCYSY